MRHSPNSRSGSVFFLILLAIAMFAGLSYAVMQSSRSSQANLSSEQARVAASEIVATADAVSKSIQRMTLAGCGQNQISFTTAQFPIVNPFAPADESCNVFSMQGGKINFASNIQQAFTMQQVGWSGFWIGNGLNDVAGIGTNGCANDSCADLILGAADLKMDVCTAINRLMGIDGIPSDVINLSAGFLGTFSATPAVLGDIGTATQLRGRSTACMLDTSTGLYTFYQVVIAR